MSDSFRSRGFQDLVPWADPYIAALIEKLRNSDDDEDDETTDLSAAIGELPPPLDNGDSNSDSPWQADWSPRNWPRG